MVIALNIILIVCGVGLLFNLYIGIKNQNTFNKRTRITFAIVDYRSNLIWEHDFSDGSEPDFKVSTDDMEPYTKTLFRLWDWGYKRILPLDKLEIIKPYLEESDERS